MGDGPLSGGKIKHRCFQQTLISFERGNVYTIREGGGGGGGEAIQRGGAVFFNREVEKGGDKNEKTGLGHKEWGHEFARGKAKGHIMGTANGQQIENKHLPERTRG